LRKKPTANDVALTADVSLGTVSHVLTGTHYVRPETRGRVERAIAELGYRPNRVARALAQRQTMTVGIVLPHIANPFFAHLAQAAEDVFGLEDYATVFGNSNNDAHKERRYLATFGDRGIDGLIVAIAAAADADEIRRLADYIPTVLVDRTVPDWQGDSVVGDNLMGMGLAVRHLFELGHERVALINGDRRLSTAREREEGFTTAAAAHNLAVTSISAGAFTFESGLEQANALLRMRDHPTAVCVGNDLLALGVLAGASALGCRVPDQLSVIGYDDIAYAGLAWPSLTTIRQLSSEMGTAAARLLLDRISGKSHDPCRIVTQPELIVRGSTAAPSSLR
jgi:LacI family transcriptional regulator